MTLEIPGYFDEVGPEEFRVRAIDHGNGILQSWNELGVEIWTLNGKVHRLDGPAVIHPDKSFEWYKNGKPHRIDGPALVEYDEGAIVLECWWYEGVPHRIGGPARIFPNGSQHWFEHGQLHRDQGPAIIRADGSQEWYHHGVLHRSDGPAVIRRRNGPMEFWTNGVFQSAVYPMGNKYTKNADESLKPLADSLLGLTSFQIIAAVQRGHT